MNLRNSTRSLIFLICLIASANSIAQIKGDDGLTISGYVETYYSYDFNDPDNHFRPQFIYCYNRTNEVNVNLAMIKLSYSKKRGGGNLFWWGGK
ncbi:MAG: outer membrane beta-barrel protein [Ignavibacteria bacterium]|nr:outer membrane beta-barrel protein [Ignavibacteria bacterium]